MKSLFLSLLAFFTISNNVSAVEEYAFKRYKYTPLDHLEFDILNEWNPIQNNLEIIFTDTGQNLPLLFFQAVGKTDEFDNTLSFVDFLKSQESTDQLQNVKQIMSNSHDAITYSYFEHAPENLYVYGLIVDVGEGILWFYLKVPATDAEDSHPIINRLITSIDFK